LTKILALFVRPLLARGILIVAKQYEWNQTARAIWQLVNCGQPYTWKISKKARSNLHSILRDQDLDIIFRCDDPYQINRNIRKHIGPFLRARDRKMAADLAVWIVSDWGGIRRGVENVRALSDALGNYDAKSIAAFLQRQGTTRISSWSKLLAFADPSNHAIYDARTSVTLNCALAQIGHARRFYMPTGRNKQIEPAYKLLKLPVPGPLLEYTDYLNLLRAIAARGGAGDILAAEMALFSNAPAVAVKFINWGGVPN
jgi:hypothetical protein